MQYIDIHTHAPTTAPGILEIENRYFPQPWSKKTPCWSAGLHPWYLNDIDLPEAVRWLREQAAQPGCLAIGEAGLDKVTATPWEIQLTAFDACIRVAAETGKPLIVHCVRAFGEIRQILQQPKSPAARLPGVVFHGFNKNEQTARMLLDAGYYLSFGAALFREKNHAAGVLRQTPADRFFLETDDQNLDIRAVYERAAEIRNWKAEQVVEQVQGNFRALFGALPG